MATTTNYGWSTPDNTGLVKDGALNIRTLGSAIDTTSATTNAAGLVFIKSQAITSGVNVVTITGAFSTTYDAYRIVFSNISLASAAATGFQLATVNSGYYQSSLLVGAYSTASGNVTYANTSNTTSYDMGVVAGLGAGATSGGTLDVENPFLTTSTTMQNFGSDPRTNGSGLRFGSGYHSATTSYTSFSYIVGGTTFTGGNIAVYGYRKAI